MDPRSAAHVLRRIAALLELQGTDRFRARAYAHAADAVRALPADDIAPLYRSGALSTLRGVGPATLAVLADLVETGESSLLERLRAETPESVVEMLRVPSLTPAKIAALHRELGVTSLDELELAARDGRLARVRGFGPKTVQRVLRDIAVVRGRAGRLLFGDAVEEYERVSVDVATHPDVTRVEPAGELRRIAPVVTRISLVASCEGDAIPVARDMTRLPGVVEHEPLGAAAVLLRFADGAEAEVWCAPEISFAGAWWEATGSTAHVAEVRALMRGESSASFVDEEALYGAAGLPWIVPELREGMGEVAAGVAGTLPSLVTDSDVQGVLHCHSTYSDGRATIAEMVAAARERGWSYLGISDHSAAAFYARGLRPDDVRRQHDEIDRLNAEMDGTFRILKGIEADILPDGRLDYGAPLLDTFDYVIGSVHSRFSMGEAEMTARVLTALDDPRLTILAHPTGRLLLAREPYAIDLSAVIEKSVAVGVALELNADPRRLDLDWCWCRAARDAGATIVIGPDAHSPAGLGHVELGVRLARKAWIGAGQLLNSRTADEIIARARARRAGAN